MKTIRTIVCKLSPTPDQQAEIDRTLVAFAAACNHVADVCRVMSSTNKYDVHHECYYAVRAEYGLSANLTQRSIARVCATLKSENKGESSFDPTSIDYDKGIFDYREQDGTFSLTLLHGRARIITVLGAFQRDALRGRKPTSATLAKRFDGGYYLHVHIKDEAPEPIAATGVLGVDMGIVNLAVDSDGATFSGDGVDEVRRRYGARRKSLNQCGSKSARRRLRKIRKKESRFRANQNHIISKRLVAKAKDTASVIAVENLKGIGGRTTARKAGRSRLKGWAFCQLKFNILYKALAAGVPVVEVDPRDTSRTCSECGHCHKSNRKSRDEFVCRQCGHTSSADFNAARNIRTKGRLSCVLTVPQGISAGVDDSGLIPRTRLPASTQLLLWPS